MYFLIILIFSLVDIRKRDKKINIDKRKINSINNSKEVRFFDLVMS